jgi:hypothetical protein
MGDLKRETKERLDEWERQLRLAIQETQAEPERERIQRELMELSTRREQLDQLDANQLKTLHDHLSRDPRQWVRHRSP